MIASRESISWRQRRGEEAVSPDPSALEIPAVSATPRPRISVMLPVYEPLESYFHAALTSVLEQSADGAEMQIAVVDDASPTVDVPASIAKIAPPGRVEYHRADHNLGLAGNWNRCIRLARGHVVHILHQDDWVLDGFYGRMLPAFSANPNVGMAFCRHAIAESPDRIVRVSHRERWRAGVLRNWLEKIAERQRIQCAAVLVRRSVYEQLGGFRPDLCYALDWEMWVRIAAHFDVWFEPQKLAFYRRHDESETSRLDEAYKTSRDMLKAIEIMVEHLPQKAREHMANAAYVSFARRALKRLQRNTTRSAEFDVQLSTVRGALDRITASNVGVKRLRKIAAELTSRAGQC